METTKEEFKKLSGIDLTDHEHSGVFPYYKNGKWSSISRGKAWQMYAKWLEDKSTSQKETIERLRESLQEVTDILYLITNGGGHPKSECKAKLDNAKQLLSTTEPKTKEQ